MTDRSKTLPQSMRRRNRGFEPASKLVAGHIKGPASKRGFAEMKLLARWAEIVGPEIAEMAQPVSLKYGGKQGLGGTLVVLSTGAQAPVLQMREQDVIARVNACYGYRAVSRMHITQTAPTGFAEGQAGFAGPKPKRRARVPDARAMAAATDQIDRVEDPRLKAALGRLAEQVLSRDETSEQQE